MLGLIAAFVLALATVALVRYKIRHRRKFYDCSGLVVHHPALGYGVVRSSGHIPAFRSELYNTRNAMLNANPLADPDEPQ